MIEPVLTLCIIFSLTLLAYFVGLREGKRFGFKHGWNEATEYYDGDILLEEEK